MLAASRAERFASPGDVARCRRLLREGSRTFAAASLILPLGVRVPSAGLYAFCRVADDAIDIGVDGATELQRLRGRLERLYRGVPDDHCADRLFADAVHGAAIPAAVPQALLEGFSWDVEKRRYHELADLKAYAVRVAGTVGVMMALLMEVRDAESLGRACELGVAMQLTNIARDVGEDARNGRLYLPLDWLRQEGIDPEAWLARPTIAPGLRRVVQRLLAVADELYASAERGIAALPLSCRPGMRAARLLYAEIGAEVARRDFDSITCRAVVSWQRKALLLTDALVGARQEQAVKPQGAMPEAAFLLAAIRDADGRRSIAPLESPRERIRWPRIEDRIGWLVDLFERLEREQSGAKGGG